MCIIIHFKIDSLHKTNEIETFAYFSPFFFIFPIKSTGIVRNERNKLYFTIKLRMIYGLYTQIRLVECGCACAYVFVARQWFENRRNGFSCRPHRSLYTKLAIRSD